jgi:hypothetical protein
MARSFNFSNIISFIRNNAFVSRIEKVTIDEIAQRGFYKIKCQLIPSKFKLDIKFIKTQNDFIYSYQLYTTKAVARWDNEPHYPSNRTFPHHFHDSEENVKESELTGNAEVDIKVVLLKIGSIIENNGN